MTSKRRWGKPYRFKLLACDERFFTAPPHSYTFDVLLPAPQELVFDALLDAEAKRMWFPRFRACRWISAPSAGSERDHRLSYMSLLERFVAIERPRHLRFYGTSCSLPLVRRIAEDLQLSPQGPDQTRLQWCVGYDPHPVARRVRYLLEPFFENELRAAVLGLESYLTDVQTGVSPAPTRLACTGPSTLPQVLPADDFLPPLRSANQQH